MPIVLLVLAILVVVGIALAAAGHGDAMSDDAPDRDGARLPERPMHRGDVDGLRFSLGLRGYRMDEVDDVLDRLAEELERRDLRIADLESRVSHRAPAVEGDEHRGVEPGDHPTIGADGDAEAEHRHDDAAENDDAQDDRDVDEEPSGATGRVDGADRNDGSDRADGGDGAAHNGVQPDGGHRAYGSGSQRVEAEDRA